MIGKTIQTFCTLLVGICVSLGFFMPQAYANDNYFGEDLGLDLYRKIDRGIGEMKYQLVSKRITGNIAKLNSESRIGKKFCRNTDGKAIVCFEEGNDFTIEELSEIENGSTASISKHLAKDVALTSDAFTSVVEGLRKYASEAKNETQNQMETYQKIGSIGLFTDGNLENSSYDLMKDLENIHAIVFAKDLPYWGIPNQTAKSVMDSLQFGNFLGNAVDSIPEGSPGPLPYNSGTGGSATIGGSTGTTVTSTGLELSSLCASGSTIFGVDAALAWDLSNQLKYGNSGKTSGNPVEISNTLASGKILPDARSGPTLGSDGSIAFSDAFGCTGFFCIDTDFVMYDSLLLWGGKSYSIESVLDQNFKIVKEFAGTSMVQAQHTNNFFELLLKNLNLPNLAHLWVVVQTLPPPILNLDPSTTPQGKSSVNSLEKEFKEVTQNIFEDYGFDYRKQNDLQTKEIDQMVRNLESLPTDILNENKVAPANKPRGNYTSSKDASLRREYTNSFSEDLFQFASFTQTFAESLESLTVLSRKFRDIPSER